MRIPTILLIPLTLLLLATSTEAQVRINEVVSSNVEGLVDDDGDTSDWIELLNYGPGPADLSGWGLSDNPSEPYKWILPPVTLPPGETLLVYASGKGQVEGSREYLTLVQDGDVWDYWPGNQPAPAGWNQLGFNPLGWSQGPSGFGFGDGDDATIVNENSVFIRTEFTLTQGEVDSFDQLYLHVDHDDGYVAYINGVEVDRRNMTGTAPAFDDFADASNEAVLYTGGTLGGTSLPDPQSTLVAGTNVLAVQVHNVFAGSSDLSIIPFLTAARPSAVPVLPDPRLEIPGYRPRHANFKLKAEGEDLVLTDGVGALVDSLSTGRMYTDTSVGRDALGAGQLIFMQPTPEDLNTRPGRPAYAEPTDASPTGGFHPTSIAVTLTVPPGTVVHYSLDGTEPTTSSPQYSGPITMLPGVTPLRASAFEPGKWASRVMTETYIVGPVPQELPMVSVVSEPDLLFGRNIGIYTDANRFGDGEIPAHVEYFDLGGVRTLSQDIGLKIHGGFGSRFNAQRSLRVIARGGYGPSEIEADLFPELGLDSYKQFLLRNAGNDWGYAHLRDGLMHRISQPEDIEIMAMQPTVVFINGEYFGIHHLRERQDEDYLAARRGVDPDNVDILELREGDPIEGDRSHWAALLDFVRVSDMNDPLVWAEVEGRVDVDNLAAYSIMQIWGGNDDWPQNNIKWWREDVPEGRWRWLLYDTDFVFGRFDDVNVNVLDHYYRSTAETAELFRFLMENDDYKRRFINRYADYLNDLFLPQRTRGLLADLYFEMEPEIDRHSARWRNDAPAGVNLTRAWWIGQLQGVSGYLRARNDVTRTQVRNYYNLPGDFTLSLDVSPAGSGSIALTALEVDGPWSGVYFQQLPVDLTAVPAPGFEFDSWSDPLLPQQPSIQVVSGGAALTLTANFRPIPDSGMVIHEINYNSDAGFDPGDWVELYNNGSAPVDLSGWTFEDSANSWTIPAGTVVPVGGFLVLAQDTAQFAAAYGGGLGALGDLGFGLSGGGELLRLRDDQGVVVDEVDYDDEAPWPTEPDGTGPTLQLIDPNLDNAAGANWQASLNVGGSPGS